MNARPTQDVQAAEARSRLAIDMLVAGAIAAAAGMALVLWVIYSLFGRALTRYVRALRGRAAEDAGFVLEPAGTAELHALAEALNVQFRENQRRLSDNDDLVAKMRELLGQVAASADHVHGASARLSDAACQARSAVQQVNQAIQNVAVGAQDTSRNAQETNAAVSQLGGAVDGIARGASEQARQIQAANATAMQMAAGVRWSKPSTTSPSRPICWR